MNRDALFVHLKDLRDLEFAKLHIPVTATHAQANVATLLQDGYDLNFVPASYRNLAAIYYIYDTMSTSQATLTDALLPEYLADGFERVCGELCLVIEQEHPHFLYTRQQEALEEASAARLEPLFSHLAGTAQTAQEQEQYAQIHALHNRVTIFFSALNLSYC